MTLENILLSIRIILPKKNDKKEESKKKSNWKILKKSRAENYTGYNCIKNEFDAIYDNTAKGIRIRNKCNCHNTVKDSKSFFN